MLRIEVHTMVDMNFIPEFAAAGVFHLERWCGSNSHDPHSPPVRSGVWPQIEPGILGKSSSSLKNYGIQPDLLGTGLANAHEI